MVRRYRAKISGPLLDRIDLRVPVRALGSHEMRSGATGESSKDVRVRVAKARRAQQRRLRRTRSRLNAFLTPRQIARYCALDAASESILRRAIDGHRLSARACHRVLKVARTIADLSGAAAIAPVHLQEALVYRTSEESR